MRRIAPFGLLRLFALNSIAQNHELKVSARSFLETFTNISLVVVCSLLVILFFAHRDFWLHGGLQKNPQAASLQGTTLNPLPEYSWSSHKETLVLALRDGCHFCEASMPFYKRLSDLNETHQVHPHLLVVMPDDRSSGMKHLNVEGVYIEGAFAHPLSSINVSGTPTLLLVNANGRVDKAWVGQLLPAQESEVLSAVEK
jgi:hypothetical protein